MTMQRPKHVCTHTVLCVLLCFLAPAIVITSNVSPSLTRSHSRSRSQDAGEARAMQAKENIVKKSGRGSGENSEVEPDWSNFFEGISENDAGTLALFVGNLDFALTEADIKTIFEQFGKIKDLHFSFDEKHKQNRGYAFIKYADSRSCRLAVDNMAGVKIGSRRLRVDIRTEYKTAAEVSKERERKDADQQINRILRRRGANFRAEDLAV